MGPFGSSGEDASDEAEGVELGVKVGAVKEVEKDLDIVLSLSTIRSMASTATASVCLRTVVNSSANHRAMSSDASGYVALALQVSAQHGLMHTHALFTGIEEGEERLQHRLRGVYIVHIVGQARYERPQCAGGHRCRVVFCKATQAVNGSTTVFEKRSIAQTAAEGVDGMRGSLLRRSLGFQHSQHGYRRRCIEVDWCKGVCT